MPINPLTGQTIIDPRVQLLMPETGPVYSPIQGIGRLAKAAALRKVLNDQQTEADQRQQASRDNIAKAMAILNGDTSGIVADNPVNTPSGSIEGPGGITGLDPNQRKRMAAQILMNNAETSGIGETLLLDSFKEQEKPKRNIIDDANGRKRDADTGELIFPDIEVTPKDNGTSLAKNLRLAGIDPESPEGQQIIRDNLTKPAATVNLPENKFESENAKKVGGFLGDSFITTQNTGKEARQQNAQLNAVENLLEGVETGRGVPTLTKLAGLANTFGIELDEDLGQKEAAQSIAAQIALRFRNPDSGLGLPGATSERELDFLNGMAPGLERSPEGRKFITRAFRQINNRKIEVAKEARRIATENEKRGITGLTFDDLDKLESMFEEPMFDEKTFELGEKANKKASGETSNNEPSVVPIGTTATNPKTGETLTWDGQQWTP